MDLSKAFDCIPHDLLASKLFFGLSCMWFIKVTFAHSYLKHRKQGVKINYSESVFQILLSDIPQGPTLGPISLNILINDFILFINLQILQI